MNDSSNKHQNSLTRDLELTQHPRGARQHYFSYKTQGRRQGSSQDGCKKNYHLHRALWESHFQHTLIKIKLVPCFARIHEHIQDKMVVQIITKPFSIRNFKNLTWFRMGAKHPLLQIDGCKCTRCTRSNDGPVIKNMVSGKVCVD